jgi:hypothetical protein
MDQMEKQCIVVVTVRGSPRVTTPLAPIPFNRNLLERKKAT